MLKCLTVFRMVLEVMVILGFVDSADLLGLLLVSKSCPDDEDTLNNTYICKGIIYIYICIYEGLKKTRREIKTKT